MLHKCVCVCEGCYGSVSEDLCVQEVEVGGGELNFLASTTPEKTS